MTIDSNRENFRKIEEKFDFQLPATFKAIWNGGHCVLQSPFEFGPNYLVMPDMIWMPLEEIPNYSFASYHLPGFVPFGTSGSGDLWCWQPAVMAAGEPRVVHCPHDCYNAGVYAQDFQTYLFRHLVEEAFLFQDSLESAAQFFEEWKAMARRVSLWLPSELGAILEEISKVEIQSVLVKARKPRTEYFILSEEQKNQILKEILDPVYFDSILWMKPLD